MRDTNTTAGETMGQWGQIILRDEKPILKKTILLLCLLFLPFVLSAEITVNWLPQAGINYTKVIGRSSYLGNIFTVGVTGGGAAEIRFGGMLGMKAGVKISQFIQRTIDSTQSFTTASGTYSYDLFESDLMLEIPVVAMFYTDPADLVFYGGLGIVPGVRLYFTEEWFGPVGTGETSLLLTTYPKKYMTGFTADTGIHWKAGSGSVTLGMTYVIYIDTISAVKTLYVQNASVYGGYLF